MLIEKFQWIEIQSDTQNIGMAIQSESNLVWLDPRKIIRFKCEEKVIRLQLRLHDPNPS